MALTAIGQARFGALAGLPVLPQGYHLEGMRNTLNGIRVDVHYKGARIFEMAIELKYVPEYDDPCGTRYAAREAHNPDPLKRSFNQPYSWTEYPDVETLVTSMITKHRLGVI